MNTLSIYHSLLKDGPTSANQIKRRLISLLLSGSRPQTNQDCCGGRGINKHSFFFFNTPVVWMDERLTAEGGRFMLPSSGYVVYFLVFRKMKEKEWELSLTLPLLISLWRLYLLCTGALCPQALVALCRVSGSYHRQCQLLDWAGKQHHVSFILSSPKTPQNDTISYIFQTFQSRWQVIIPNMLIHVVLSPLRLRLLSFLSNEQDQQ